jgi:hypothetical protein
MALLYRLYFPPVTEDESAADDESKLKAEAEAVASELPSAPTSDPSDPGHAGKKQKQEDS